MRKHKDAPKQFDYTTIADRHRVVSWSKLCHPACVVKPDNGIQPSRLPQKLCNPTDTH